MKNKITDDELIVEYIKKISGYFISEFNIQNNFFNNLLSEKSDWVFVVQLHALIEGAVNHAIGRAINKKYEEFFVNVNIQNKLKFLTKNKILEKKYANFAKEVALLRNRLVHNIKNITFNFDESDYSVEVNKIKSTIVKIFPNIESVKRMDDVRFAIYISLIVFLGKLYYYCDSFNRKPGGLLSGYLENIDGENI